MRRARLLFATLALTGTAFAGSSDPDGFGGGSLIPSRAAGAPGRDRPALLVPNGRRWDLAIEPAGRRWDLAIEPTGRRWDLAIEPAGRRWTVG